MSQIRIELYKDNTLVKSFQGNYRNWGEVSCVQVAEDRFQYNSTRSGANVIAFACFTSPIIRVNKIDDLNDPRNHVVQSSESKEGD